MSLAEVLLITGYNAASNDAPTNNATAATHHPVLALYSERYSTHLNWATAFPSAFSIAVKFRPTDMGGSRHIVNGGAGVNGIRWTSAGALQAVRGSTVSQLFPNGSIAQGQWYDFAATYDGTQWIGYLDGVAGTPVADSGGFTSNTFEIGSGDATFPCRADMSSLAVYDVALSTTDATAASNGELIDNADLVAMWPLGEGVGNRIYNYAGGQVATLSTVFRTNVARWTNEPIGTVDILNRLAGRHAKNMLRVPASAWTKTRSVLTEGAATNPFGSASDAMKLTETATVGTHEMQQTVPSNTYVYAMGKELVRGVCISVYAKAVERSVLQLTDNWGTTTFNLSGGAVSSSTAGQGEIIDAGGGWWRCVRRPSMSTSSQTITAYLVIGDSPATGVVNEGLLIYRPQLSYGEHLQTHDDNAVINQLGQLIVETKGTSADANGQSLTWSVGQLPSIAHITSMPSRDGAVVMADTFTAADGTQINGRTPNTTQTQGGVDSTWVTYLGNSPVITNNSFRHPLTGGTFSAAAVDTKHSDGVLSATGLCNNTNSRLSLILRGTLSTDYLELRFNGFSNTVELFSSSWVNSLVTITQRGAAVNLPIDISALGTFDVSVRLSGSEIGVTMDGSEFTVFTYSLYQMGTFMGCGCLNVAALGWDNISFARLAP